MTAPLHSHAPIGTPVWVEVRPNLWLAGELLSPPFGDYVRPEHRTVQVLGFILAGLVTGATLWIYG